MKIPAGEADLLSIYFEEVSAHQYKQNQDMKRQSHTGGRSQGREITDLEIGDEDDE